jgi:hypothetical protein
MILGAAYAVDEYCGGVETLDVLNCVASALDGFNFYNGASVEDDVRYALRRGCSHTLRRGSPPLRLSLIVPLRVN